MTPDESQLDLLDKEKEALWAEIDQRRYDLARARAEAKSYRGASWLFAGALVVAVLAHILRIAL